MPIVLLMPPAAVATWIITYVLPVGTLAAAITAVVFSRRAAKETLRKDFRIRTWEKCADVYVTLLEKLDAQDPHHFPPIESVYRESDGKEVTLLREDVLSPEWKGFEARLRAYASPRIWGLYVVWRELLNGWTMMRCGRLVHFKGGQPGFYEKFSEDERTAASDIHRMSQLIAAQIRADLRFERIPEPTVTAIHNELGLVERIIIHDPLPDDGKDSWASAVVFKVKREPGRLRFSVAVGSGMNFSDKFAGSKPDEVAVDEHW